MQYIIAVAYQSVMAMLQLLASSVMDGIYDPTAATICSAVCES